MESSIASLTSARGKTKKSTLPTPDNVAAAFKRAVVIAKELDLQERELHKAKKASKAKKGKEAEHPVKREFEVIGMSGRAVTLNEVKSLKTANYKNLKHFTTLYRRTYGKVPADRLGTANSAFNTPVLLTTPLADFISRGDFGTASNGQSLAALVGSVGNGVTSRAILSTLLSLYAKKHKLYMLARENAGKSGDQINRQVIGADAVMLATLGPLFDALEAKDAADPKKPDGGRRAQNKRGTRKYVREDGSSIWSDHFHKFRRDNFSYPDFQRLFSSGGIVDKKAAGPGGVASNGFNFNSYRIEGPEGKNYMMQLAAHKEAVKAGRATLAGFDYPGVARAAAAAAGVAPSTGLVMRATLDTVHAVISDSSKQYNEKVAKKQRPKKAKKVGA